MLGSSQTSWKSRDADDKFGEISAYGSVIQNLNVSVSQNLSERLTWWDNFSCVFYTNSFEEAL